jgi:chromosome segregation protein
MTSRPTAGSSTSSLDQLRTTQTEARASLSLWYAENNQINKQAETIQRELAVGEERARQYAAQRDEILAELEPLTTNLEGQRNLVTQNEAALQQIDQELAQAETLFEQARQQLAVHESQLREARQRQTAAEQQARTLADGVTRRQALLTQFDERRAALQADSDEQTGQISQLQEQQQALEQQQLRLAQKQADLEADQSAVDSRHELLRRQLTDLNQAADQLKLEMTALDQQESTLKTRQDMLGKLRSDMSGYFAGVRAVLQSKSELAGVIGTVSQVLQVPPDLEVALEAALGGRLQDVVVERFQDAESAIAHLKRQNGGRATFLPLDTIHADGPVKVPALPGVLGLAADLVSVAEERLRPVVGYALNRTVMVEDLPAARRLFREMKGGFQIVTRDGELMRSGGSVTGGRTNRKQEGTFLAREREWREIPRQLSQVAAKQTGLSTRLGDNQQQANELKTQLQEVESRQQQLTTQQQEVTTVLTKAVRTLEQLSNSLTWQQELQAKTSAALNALDTRQQETNQEIDQMRQEYEAAAAEAERLTAETQLLSADSLRAELSQAEANARAIRVRRQTQQTQLSSNQTIERQLTAQIENKQARADALAADRQALLNQQGLLQQESTTFSLQLTRFSDKIHSGEKELSELESRQIQLQENERQLRQRVQRSEMEHNRLDLEAGRCQNELDNLQNQIHEDLGLVQLEMSAEQIGQPVLPIVNDLPLVEDLPVGVSDDVKRLKVQIRRLGNINLDAPHEYSDTRERYDFLTEQISDLEAAVTDLREIIAKLDETMRESFIETFQQVAMEFQRYFKALFGGGEAKLLLTAPDNLIETGVDIVARPPGKRLQSMALLSGGERSLTAQALIFALLRISPTPFVIFDEVDAMLDEANVGRFRDALSNLAREIQFIVITHNRRTIEAANTLYGISMGDDSVSQVYSLKIDEWLATKGGQRS